MEYNKKKTTHSFTFPWPDRSSSIKPFSVPINKLTPHNAAHKISELNRFLYLRISGVSLDASCDVGVTLTLTWLSRRDGPEPPAPNPNVRKLRCFCCRAYACIGNTIGDEVALTAAAPDDELLMVVDDGDDDEAGDERDADEAFLVSLLFIKSE